MSDRVHNLSAGQSDELAVNNRKLSEAIIIMRAQCEATVALNEELRIARTALTRLAEALEAQQALIARQLELLTQSLALQTEAIAEMQRGREHMERQSTPAVQRLARQIEAARTGRGLV